MIFFMWLSHLDSWLAKINIATQKCCRKKQEDMQQKLWRLCNSPSATVHSQLIKAFCASPLSFFSGKFCVAHYSCFLASCTTACGSQNREEFQLSTSANYLQFDIYHCWLLYVKRKTCTMVNMEAITSTPEQTSKHGLPFSRRCYCLRQTYCCSLYLTNIH